MWVIGRDNALGDALLAATWTANLLTAGHDACAAMGSYRHLVTVPQWTSIPRPFRVRRSPRVRVRGRIVKPDFLFDAQGPYVLIQTDHPDQPYYRDEGAVWRDMQAGLLSSPELNAGERWWCPWYEDPAPGLSMLEEAQWRFGRDTGLFVPLRHHVPPVRFEPVPQESLDVAIWPNCGEFSRYRQWPYWDDLYDLLNSAHIRWRNMLADGLRDQQVLNCVYHSKLYVGLETGVSHYVSAVARQGLIIQSGYAQPEFWSPYKQYDFIEVRQPCSPCWLREGCHLDHACMTNIPATRVFDEILRRLSRPTP